MKLQMCIRDSFNTVVTGPGKIILQTMPVSGVAAALAPFFPSGS